MSLYLIRQYPKPKWRTVMVSIVGLVEANSGAAAIRKAVADGAGNDFGFTDHKDYCKPSAELFEAGKAYMF